MKDIVILSILLLLTVMDIIVFINIPFLGVITVILIGLIFIYCICIYEEE